MYYDYFGLKQPPFKITPDTSMFFPGGNRGAILDALIYTVLNGEGIIKVVGEVGSGKTMLCRMLEKELPDNVEVVYIANPSLSPENTLHAIAFDLDLGVQASTSRLEVMNKLQQYLLAKHSDGQHVVVFIEEAQSMPVATLEEIRLLSNLETQQNKLLQIVLFGQPELDQIISQREIRQLKERITYSFQLNPFNAGDIRDYLNARLRTCGYRSGEIFDTKATQLIERYSAGLVRRINILADKSMLAAFASNSNSVTAGHVKKAARDSEFVSDWHKKYWLPVMVVAFLAILAVFTGWLISKDRQTSGGTTAARNNDQQVGRIVTESALTDSNSTHTIIEEAGSTVSGPKIVNTNKQGKAGIGPPPADTIDNQPAMDGSGPGQIPVRQPGLQSAFGNSGETSDDAGFDADNKQVAAVPQAEIIDPVQTTGMANLDLGPEAQLMGLDDLFDPGQMAPEQYTDGELQMMREQLQRLPPEVAFHLKPLADSDACKLCWSIIYRPLSKADNL